jgi:hypothetical protein
MWNRVAAQCDRRRSRREPPAFNVVVIEAGVSGFGRRAHEESEHERSNEFGDSHGGNGWQDRDRFAGRGWQEFIAFQMGFSRVGPNALLRLIRYAR